MNMSQCLECGDENVTQSNFCSNCGTSFSISTVNFIQAIKLGFRGICDFGGRATRAEFWYWYLFTMILFAFVWAILLFTRNQIGSLPYWSAFIWGLLTVGLLLSISVRRLHDTGKRGWLAVGQFFLFSVAAFPGIGLIFIVPFLWLLKVSLNKGQSGGNKYGPDPRANYK